MTELTDATTLTVSLSPVPLVLLADAVTTTLGEARPKPTATTPGQRESSVVAWTSPDGVTETGVWEASPGSFTATRDGYHEICQILSGRATIESDGGQTTEVSAGDLFVMPTGWSGTWHVAETLRKTYVTVTVV
ncbi:cupin domain-containing protein [Glaciibacter psychrotolerans]|uniref:(S)-ureidoglycine aminohydrolase cupin domain-containing protein n=1 Tax=Glaciibacter psychrotolerans TaxID=670054 RepID=A0A7Z0J734_9MICO|nr:cupin domain-containing protein [Leifsonia psychrotolerans]NYJ20509.1 hypothetical protein [Leifsonia psychrotolerans]